MEDELEEIEDFDLEELSEEEMEELRTKVDQIVDQHVFYQPTLFIVSMN